VEKVEGRRRSSHLRRGTSMPGAFYESARIVGELDAMRWLMEKNRSL